MGSNRKRRGQALVELALALPVLIVLIAGVLELGRGYSFAALSPLRSWPGVAGRAGGAGSCAEAAVAATGTAARAATCLAN